MLETLKNFLHILVLYEANGFLVLTYVLWEHLASVLVLMNFVFFAIRAPAGQRAWTLGGGVLPCWPPSSQLRLPLFCWRP